MTVNKTLDNVEQSARQEELIAKAWSDPAFRARLQEDPRAVLTELGIPIAGDARVEVVQDSDRVLYLHIPKAPPQGEVRDEEIMGAQGGLTVPLTTIKCSWAPQIPK